MRGGSPRAAWHRASGSLANFVRLFLAFYIFFNNIAKSSLASTDPKVEGSRVVIGPSGEKAAPGATARFWPRRFRERGTRPVVAPLSHDLPAQLLMGQDSRVGGRSTC